jgi:hypothetical protein
MEAQKAGFFLISKMENKNKEERVRGNELER